MADRESGHHLNIRHSVVDIYLHLHLIMARPTMSPNHRIKHGIRKTLRFLSTNTRFKFLDGYDMSYRFLASRSEEGDS